MRTLLLLAASTALAQPPVTLDQAVRTALDRYPAISRRSIAPRATTSSASCCRNPYSHPFPVTTTGRTFVVRARNGRAEWVNVAKGAPEGDLIEVSESLQPGHMIVKRGTDEIREGPLK